MNTFLFAFVISSVFSTAFIAVLSFTRFERFFIRKNRSLRDAHVKGIPRSGGVGIVLGFLSTLLLAYALIGGFLDAPENPLIRDLSMPMVVFLLGGVGIFLVGLADDLWNLRMRYKLTGQLGVAVFFSIYGLQISQIDLPIYGSYELGWMAWPLTVFWILGVMNAFNLIDGLDGLASGLAIIALAGLLVIATLQGNFAIVVFCVALVGAILGFWLFNQHPASIFMGDSGSLFLGYVLSTLCIWVLTHPQTGAVTLLPGLLLAIPLLDTLFSFARRYLKGIPFYSADQDHIHHRLLAKGYTVRQAVWILYLFAFGFAGLTLAVYWEPAWYLMSYLMAILFGYLMLFFLEYKEIKSPFKTVKNASALKRKRSFVYALSEHIHIFFAKDQTLNELLKSFDFWASQMKMTAYSIEAGDNVLIEYSASSDLGKKLCRQFTYQQGILCIILQFEANELAMDSDVKGTMMEQVIKELIQNIHRLYGNLPLEPAASLQQKETTYRMGKLRPEDYN